MKLPRLFLAALVTCPAVAFAADGHHAPHWGYTDHTGPSHWASMDAAFAACDAGKAQSPINITGAANGHMADLAFAYGTIDGTIVNNGHTIQVNVPQGQTLTVGDQTYNLLQFHFHAPSENEINGKSFPLEMHLVHKRADGTLGVVGVMFEEGAANPEIETLWKHMPDKEGATASVEHINLNSLLPADHGYYSFSGSLTTPPCSEGVNWHVMAHPLTLSAEQLAAFHHLYAMNARPVQPLNGRTIMHNAH